MPGFFRPRKARSAHERATGLGVTIDLSGSPVVVERGYLIGVLGRRDLQRSIAPIEGEGGHARGAGVDMLGLRRAVAIEAGEAAVVLVLGDEHHVIARRAAAGRVGVGGTCVVRADPNGRRLIARVE